MKFVRRSHYCSECEKNVYFLSRNNAKTIEQDFTCPRCENKVISFWEEINTKYVLPYIIGTPFFGASVIYGFWTSLIGAIRGVDIFIMIINIVIASVIVVSGMRHKQKPEIPNTSERTILELRIRKIQILWILLFTLVGYLAALVIDVILYFSWVGIEALIN